jgi:hypothetical protein
MAGLLTLVISFLARLVGLGKVSDHVIKIVNKIRAPIDKALDKVVGWIVNTAKKLGKLVVQAGVPKDPAERLRLGLDAAVKAVNALRGAAIAAPLITPVLAAIKVRYGLKTLQPMEKDGDWWIEAEVNPKTSKKTLKKSPAAGAGAVTGMDGSTKAKAIEIPWYKPALKSYKKIVVAKRKDDVAAALKTTGNKRLKQSELIVLDHVEVGPQGSRPLDDITIGVTHPVASKIASGFEFQAGAKVTGDTRKDHFNAVLERYGYNREDNADAPTDGDHVLEKQLGGPDHEDNVWPLNSSVNRNSGSKIRGDITRIVSEQKWKNATELVGKWLRLKF